MAYATLADVLALAGRLTKSITATSTPSLADVQRFLDQRSNQIDSVLLSRGIAVPVTLTSGNATAMGELLRLNAQGAAADTMNAAFITNDSNDRGTGAILLRSYEATLAAWVKGDGIPVGLAIAEADMAVMSNWNSGGACPPVPLFSRANRGSSW